MTNPAPKSIESLLLNVVPGAHDVGLPDQLVSEIKEALGTITEPEFLEAVEAQGKEWGYQPRHEIATAISTSIIKALIGVQEVKGKERIQEAIHLANEGYSVTMVSNHLSYGDINYLQTQLRMQGVQHVPLLVMAGPKVYSDTFRKLSSMSFETLKMAQPPSRASGGAADVSMRELAEVTRKVITEAEYWMNKGRILYFFPEGSRSRTGDLQRFVAASARYCNFEKSVVFPVGYKGTEGLLSLDDGKIHFEDIQVSLGEPIFYSKVAEKLEGPPAVKRKTWMDVLGYAVADLVDPEIQGVYCQKGSTEVDLEVARQVYLTMRNR